MPMYGHGCLLQPACTGLPVSRSGAASRQGAVTRASRCIATGGAGFALASESIHARPMPCPGVHPSRNGGSFPAGVPAGPAPAGPQCLAMRMSATACARSGSYKPERQDREGPKLPKTRSEHSRRREVAVDPRWRPRRTCCRPTAGCTRPCRCMSAARRVPGARASPYRGQRWT